MFAKVCLKVFAILIWFPFAANAQDNGFDHQHGLWEEQLRLYVVDSGSASTVRYALWKNQQQNLDIYLKQISEVNQKSFDAWSPDQQLAFLINAYNAFTVKLVLNHYPLKSIKDIGSFFRSSWKIRFFKLFQQERHLDHIEHELIRGKKDFNEPRIHFALVCASIGCPKLQARAFTAQRLESMLESGAEAFLKDSSRNRYENDVLYLSSIFKWYGEDFIKTHGSVLKFVRPYMDLPDKKIRLEYLDYNWALNDSR